MSTRSMFKPALLGAVHGVSLTPKKGMELIDYKALGLVMPMQGGARGIGSEGDVITQTTDGRDLNALWDEFSQTLLARNERRQTLIDFLTYPVSQIIEDVPQVGTDDFEEASEYGEPKSIRPPMSYFSMAYDFKWYDLATRFSWKFLAEASAAQVEAFHNSALEADNRLVFNKVFKTIFNSTNLTTDIRGNNYNVYKFYNNDGTTPPEYNGITHSSSHTHYLSSGAATIDSDDVESMYEHLRHHGYSEVTGMRIVLMVNPAEGKEIRRFRANTINNNSKTALYDFIPALGSAPFILPSQGLIGNQPSAELEGLRVIGQYGPILIVEEDYIPVGYTFMFATGGKENVQNPVGFREHQNASLRGLRLIAGDRGNYPLVGSFYNRGFGTGIRQRGAGVCMRISASAWAIPAAYA